MRKLYIASVIIFATDVGLAIITMNILAACGWTVALMNAVERLGECDK